jgi:hypothetical protein
MIHFYKNLIMAVAFIHVMTYAAGGMSIDKTTARQAALARTDQTPSLSADVSHAANTQSA